MLAEQVFCEARLDLRLTTGLEERKPSPSRARLVLETLLEARRKLPPRRDEVFTLSVPIATVLQGVPIVGRPPAAVFRGNCVAALYAARQSRRHKLYPGDRVKLYTYAAMLNSLGLMCNDARLALLVGVAPEDIYRALIILGDATHPRPVASGGFTVHVLAHDPGVEEETLAPLLAYWRGERAPRPRRGPWCSSCPVKEDCFTLFP